MSNLESLRSRANVLKKKRASISKGLNDLETDLIATFGELPIYGSSVDVTLGDIGPDHRLYGHLSYSTGQLSVSFRSSEQDEDDDYNNYPEEYRSYSLRPLSASDSDWLQRLASDEVINSLLNSLSERLDELENSSVRSIKALNRTLNSQLNTSSRDAEILLSETGEEKLLNDWLAARDQITIDPLESITRSSSYLESVCRKILSDLKLPLPNKKDITGLVSACTKGLGLSDDPTAENDLKQLVGGVKSIFQAVGCLRTHFGTAHGSDENDYQPGEAYARLANGVAAAVGIFLLQRLRQKLNNSCERDAVNRAAQL